MKKHKWILFFVLLGFFACNDNDYVFAPSTDGLKIEFTPVAGGAMMYYTLPDNSDIFAMNVRYKDWQGQDVLKACGYSGDSLLLDGFTQGQEVHAQISFVNQNNEESAALEYQFSTLDSAPWKFFEGIEVTPSWNGYQVIYKSPAVVTGMAHIFYLGTNPTTHQEDTILVNSFPILQGGDTLSFVLQQEREKNTVIIRTEDFLGFRVRQEIYPDIDAFRTEQWPMTAADFISGPSVENTIAKTGVAYLFDGEVLGRERLIASATEENKGERKATQTVATYLAGPHAYEDPIILDMREEKIPAWIRLYCLYPMNATFPVSNQELCDVWIGSYADKIPCHVSVYGNKESSDPNADGWVRIGELNQDPTPETLKDRWSYLTTQTYLAPDDVNDLENKDPIYVDIQFPPQNNTYRYLKIVVHDTFDSTNIFGINYNEEEYFTLHELEVYVKKD